MRSFVIALVLVGVGHGLGDAQAQSSQAKEITNGKVALVHLDSLGMDSERVARLETLFRVEIERLSPAKPPSGRSVRRLLSKPEHRDCGGEPACLVAIGKALGVDVVVAGNVASLADAFVVNIKALSVASGEELSRVASEPLRGNPDDLIENVRVAAYRLLAPSKLLGKISVIADIDGAEILVDGKLVGKTPLSKPVGKLAVGERKVEVRAAGYRGFTDSVTVQFEKTSQVVVSLSGAAPAAAVRAPEKPLAPSKPFYKKGWFWVAVGTVTAAVVVGAVIGTALGEPDIKNCNEGFCAARF